MDKNWRTGPLAQSMLKFQQAQGQSIRSRRAAFCSNKFDQMLIKSAMVHGTLVFQVKSCAD